MELSLQHLGCDIHFASNIIELTVTDGGNTLVTSITNSNGMVDTELITTLREIADDLEIQNERASKKMKKDDYKEK